MEQEEGPVTLPDEWVKLVGRWRLGHQNFLMCVHSTVVRAQSLQGVVGLGLLDFLFDFLVLILDLPYDVLLRHGVERAGSFLVQEGE